MTPVEHFVALLEASEPLDRLMASIASVDPNNPPETFTTTTLDDLANRVPNGNAHELVREVFGPLGFTGNSSNYYDVRNSLLPHVIRRRLGIPLTLAVVAIEVGRRHGLALQAIGMPGHVLLAEEGSEDRWFDPFAGGQMLDRNDCERIFHSVHPGVAFERRFLEPMSNIEIVARTLENLRVACLGSGRLDQLASTLELRTALPSAPVGHRVDYARVLETIGRYDAAAKQRELLVALDADQADHHSARADRLRASRN